MTTTTIIRGSEMDRKAYIWAVSDQGYTGTWADWQAMPLDEREEYESGAAGGGPTHAVVEQIKVCGGTATTTDLTAAIARSRSHNEIVSIEIEAKDISEVLADLAAIYDGEIDDARENDGTYGAWGWTEDMAEGEMDWRLNIRLATKRITAENFDETFPLEYASALASRVSDVEVDSAIVTTLVNWCKDHGYLVSRQVCCDVLESLIESDE